VAGVSEIQSDEILMKTKSRLGNIGAAVVVTGIFASRSCWACATCFGSSDSKMAEGMNMGIVTLLAVVGVMLTSLAVSFVVMARRSARLATANAGVDGDEEGRD
jgi:hypothetical protein